MVNRHQSFCSRNAHSSSGSQYIALYGYQSLWMGSSSRTIESILSWSLTNPRFEIMAIRFALKKAFKYIHNSCVMISTNNTTVVSYINKQGRAHSPNLLVEVWKILSWFLEQHTIIRVRHIPGRFNVLADRLSRMDKPIKTELALDQSIVNSIFQIFSYPNVDVFATRFSHKLPLYVSPVLDNQALAIDAFSMKWNLLQAYAFPPAILIPSVLAKICQSQCRIVLIAPLWPQRQWFSEVLQLLVSAPVRLPLFPKLLTQAKGKFQHPNLPLLDLHAWELSNNQSEIKYFRKTLQILSQNQAKHLDHHCCIFFFFFFFFFFFIDNL